MDKEVIVKAILVAVLAVVVGSLIIGGIVWWSRSIQEEAEIRCADLSERLGYETQLISGYCYIQVCPGLRVREDQVLDFLPVIDCRRNDE